VKYGNRAFYFLAYDTRFRAGLASFTPSRVQITRVSALARTRQCWGMEGNSRINLIRRAITVASRPRCNPSEKSLSFSYRNYSYRANGVRACARINELWDVCFLRRTEDRGRSDETRNYARTLNRRVRNYLSQVAMCQQRSTMSGMITRAGRGDHIRSGHQTGAHPCTLIKRELITIADSNGN